MVVVVLALLRQERNPSKKMTKRNQSAIRSVMRKFTEHAMLYQHTTEKKLAEYRYKLYLETDEEISLLSFPFYNRVAPHYYGEEQWCYSITFFMSRQVSK